MESLKISVIIRGGRGDDEEDVVMAWLDSLPKDKNGEPYKDTIQKHLARALFQYVAHGLPKIPLLNHSKSIINGPVVESIGGQQRSVSMTAVSTSDTRNQEKQVSLEEATLIVSYPSKQEPDSSDVSHPDDEVIRASLSNDTRRFARTDTASSVDDARATSLHQGESHATEIVVKQDYQDLRRRISKSIRRVADG
jgi:hypothetical protein